MQSSRNKTRRASSSSEVQATPEQDASPVATATATATPANATLANANATHANATATPAEANAKPEAYGENPNLETFLNMNASEAFRRPWHRLERGLRLNRLRKFILSEKEKLNLSDPDTEYLTNLLHKSLDKKLLNSKSSVIYSIELQEIQEIKGLVYHKNAEGRVLSQIIEKKGITFRKPQQH